MRASLLPLSPMPQPRTDASSATPGGRAAKGGCAASGRAVCARSSARAAWAHDGALQCPGTGSVAVLDDGGRWAPQHDTSLCTRTLKLCRPPSCTLAAPSQQRSAPATGHGADLWGYAAGHPGPAEPTFSRRRRRQPQCGNRAATVQPGRRADAGTPPCRGGLAHSRLWHVTQQGAGLAGRTQPSRGARRAGAAASRTAAAPHRAAAPRRAAALQCCAEWSRARCRARTTARRRRTGAQGAPRRAAALKSRHASS